MIDRFFKSVEAAGKNTKALLWPFRSGVWGRLFFLFLLTGSFWFPSSPPSASSSRVNDSPPINAQSLEKALPEWKDTQQKALDWTRRARTLWIENRKLILTLLGLGAGILFLISVLFLWISSRLKMVLIKCLLTKEVHIRSTWRETSELGNSFFKTRFIAWFLLLLPILGIAGTLGYGFTKGMVFFKTIGFWWILIGAAFFCTVALAIMALWLINQFLPIHMIQTQQLSSKAISDILSRGRQSFLKGFVYLFLYAILSFAIGIAVMIGMLMIGVPSLLLFGGLFAGGVILFKSTALILKIMALLIGIVLAGSAVLLISVAVLVPLETFFATLRIELVGYLNPKS